MLVQIKKGRDSQSTLACVRPDGTRTWSKVHPFFPVHDITHYAVESVFGFGQAFFGLVASGWTIDGFTDPATRAHLPAEAVLAEHLVGLFDLERGSGRLFSVDEFNEALAESLRHHGLAPFRPVLAGDLMGVRTLRGDLTARWTTLAPGDTLEVPFPASIPA